MDNVQEVVAQIEEKRRQIEALWAEAEKLARSVDLHFVYVSGYDYFKVVDEDEWNSSSIC